ncbi:NAD(P)H-binding protein [Pseudokineococcus basanitobsidens]|uniref:NAD(P)H-binding protein n=1 Tax=Pseudokineococcus basanitobsidens TaxID=1926649 RepID=A0ABU8RN26_9ACTN
MRAVVIGAGGGVGRQVVTAATAAGHEVVAAARDVPDYLPVGARAVTVDVRDGAAVAAVVRGADAVAWCVGVSARSGPDVARQGMAHLVAAAEPGLRVVSVSGAGADLPGDTKGVGARLVSALTHRLAADLVTDKEGEHAVLAASDLAWTQVRPPRLVDAAPAGGWQLGERAPGLRAAPLPRADVAAAVLDLLTTTAWVRRAPFLLAGPAASAAAGSGDRA